MAAPADASCTHAQKIEPPAYTILRREDGLYNRNSSSLGYDGDDEMHSIDLGNISIPNSEGSRFEEFRPVLVSSPLDPQFVPIPEGELEARIKALQNNLFVREPTPPIETVLQVLTPPGFQNIDAVLNPNGHFDESDIVQADSGDSVERTKCYSRVISESDDRSSVMDIDSTSESGSVDVNVSQDRVLNPNENFHMSDIVQADTDDSVEPLEGYSRIISESDDRSSPMDIDDASGVSSIAEEKSSFETNISTPDGQFFDNSGGIESEHIIPETQSDACPPDSLPHPTQDDEGCRCEESSSTGDISTPERLVCNTQNSVESLVLQLDSSDAVLSDDSVRTGKRCCVNDSGESCGRKRRRTLSEGSVMDEQMGAPAVDRAMEQSSQSDNSQHAGAHPGVIDPPQLESDGDQGEDFNISGE
ncbi:hypothetical protein QAD02_021052 [Eretmocerus hayati]|uniref:Uncharacterized protein n=1 Tax=Eretmocerus hayati TaxID=131215 RepID=A0ACC2PPL9_9HYME|nr:hypothetical protein QAD02_021052 [Eretmocerus hayati]